MSANFDFDTLKHCIPVIVKLKACLWKLVQEQGNAELCSVRGLVSCIIWRRLNVKRELYELAYFYSLTIIPHTVSRRSVTCSGANQADDHAKLECTHGISSASGEALKSKHQQIRRVMTVFFREICIVAR